MATIIQFPSRPADDQRRALLARNIQRSYDIPARDPELALLIQMAASLLSSMEEDTCDRFIDRLARWEASNSA